MALKQADKDHQLGAKKANQFQLLVLRTGPLGTKSSMCMLANIVQNAHSDSNPLITGQKL